MTTIIRLQGAAARHVVYNMAFTYALLSIKSRLCYPAGTVNAPWFGIADREKMPIEKAYLKWIAGVDADLLSYRSAMASLIHPVPPAPTIEWRTWKAPDTGKVYPCHYSGTKAKDAASAYATMIVRKTVVNS